jgi:hypothetical protein
MLLGILLLILVIIAIVCGIRNLRDQKAWLDTMNRDD